MEEQTDLKSKIHYFFRQKQFNSMVGACKEGIGKFKTDMSFHLFHSMALICGNRIEEGIHELEPIRAENEVKLATNIALMYSYKLTGAGKDLLGKLEAQTKEIRKSADALDFYYSAFVLFAFNKLDKALEYCNKSLSLESFQIDCLALKAWIKLELRKQAKIDLSECLKNLKAALEQKPRHLDAILALSQLYLHFREYREAMNLINKAVVKFQHTNLPLLQKLKFHLAQYDFDLVLETMNRINSTDPRNLETQKLSVLIILCKTANFDEALIELKKFYKMLDEVEPNNILYYLEVVSLFSRTCGKNKMILSETKIFLEKLLQNNDAEVNIMVELGFVCLRLEELKEAFKYFKASVRVNKTILGVLGCAFCEFHLKGDVESQLNLLSTFKEKDNCVLYHYLNAKLKLDPLMNLNKIVEIQLEKLDHFPYSSDYLLMLDPDFMLDVVKEYLNYIAGTDANKKPSEALDNAFSILNLLTKACPGFHDAIYILAKLQYLRNETGQALKTLESILAKVISPQSEAQLLLAQIQVQHGLVERAAQSLELAVSNDFKIRENPLFHYITALVDKEDSLNEAIKSLRTALSLINKTSEISLSDKASMYSELIACLNEDDQAEEAYKVLEEATEDLRGSAEEAKLILLSTDLALKKGNVSAALEMLKSIKASEPSYLQARKKHADILLKYHKDKNAYLACYKELLGNNPGPEEYVLLGDAYMKVLETDEALDCYQKALSLNQEDSFLIAKMGKALVQTHFFTRAVEYYKEAIARNQDDSLKLELGSLYMNLRQYDKAELLLLDEIEKEGRGDVPSLQHRTKVLILLAKVQEKAGNHLESVKTLRDAMDNQIRLKKRLALEQTTTPVEEISVLMEIASKLALMSIGQKNNEQAISFYKEALEASPNNVSVLVDLAKLYMQMNYLELCQQTCNNILRVDADNEAASVMMADIAFRKVDFDMAQFHFTQLVAKQPTNWTALVRLIEILRRIGKVEDSLEYLTNAKNSVENPSRESGLLYCTGLYQWYSGNLNGALRNFNAARQDAEFGQNCIYNMIEICLNPDDEMLTDQFVDTDDIEYRDSRTMALKTADRLLKELKQRLEAKGDEVLRYRLLSNFRQLATKEKYNIERGLEDFVILASQNAYRDHIGVTLGIATAYTLLKQGQRAKNQLKRIVKNSWNFEDAEYLERCWLLLADYYIQSAKFDIATDMVNKVLQHNKSCVKGYEYMGFILEKEQRYKEAAGSYENAWKFGNKANPNIGYKLAFNLMKCKKYPAAIEIAQEVLRLSPEFPRVRKDILDKCMNNLRI